MTRLWTLGTLVPGLPSLFKDFLTTYWQTSSSLERLSSFKILLAFWGCNCSRSRNILLSLFYHDQTENSDWPPPYQTDLCFLSPALHMRDATHSLISRCALPWGSRCLASWENLAFGSHHWASAATSVAPAFRTESTNLAFIIHFAVFLSVFLMLLSGKEMYTADHWGGSSKKDLSLHALFSFLRQGLTV